MLGNYKKVLTRKGAELHAKCLAGTSSSITFTKFVLGNGTYTGSESTAAIAAMTTLRSAKKEYQVTAAEIVNAATCKLTLNASNLEVTQGFYVTEIGVYAKGSDNVEVLYSVTVADPEHPDWMPAYNNVAPGSLRYLDYISVGNADSITIHVSPGGLVSIEDFEALEGRVTALEEAGAGMVGVKRMCAADGTPQSSTVWTRIGQAAGATVEYARGNEAVQNDLMDMWPYNQIKPCNLKMDGTVLAYLGDAGFDWYCTDGTDAEDTSVMDEIPTDMYIAHFFQKDANGQNWEYKVIADSPRYPNSVYVKDLMKRADGTTQDHFYFPIFLGSINSDGHYVSRAGVAPKHNASVTSLRTSVLTNGDDWQIIDVWAWEVFTYLCEVMCANANFRSTFGRGFGESGGVAYAAQNTGTGINVISVLNADAGKFEVGQTISIGTAMWNYSIAMDRTITAIADSSISGCKDITFDGAAVNIDSSSMVWRAPQITGKTVNMASPNGTAGANDGLHSVRCLYVEDLYGMMHTGVDGLNLKFNETDICLEMYVCTDPSKYSDAYGTGYTKLSKTLALSPTANNNELSGYIKKEYFIREYPLLEMPEDTTGGSATYEAAYVYKNKNGQRPFFGGPLSGGALVSPRCRHCPVSFSNSHAYCGSRPLKR